MICQTLKLLLHMFGYQQTTSLNIHPTARSRKYKNMPKKITYSFPPNLFSLTKESAAEKPKSVLHL